MLADRFKAVFLLFTVFLLSSPRTFFKNKITAPPMLGLNCNAVHHKKSDLDLQCESMKVTHFADWARSS